MSKFKKGAPSPNPKGRPKGSRNTVPPTKELQDAILAQTLPTLQKLIALRESENTSETAMVNVCKTLMTWSMEIMAQRSKKIEAPNPQITEPKGNVTPLFSTKAVEKQ